MSQLGGGAFDFHAAAQPATDDSPVEPDPERERWKSVDGGLSAIWLGSGLQVLAITALVLYVIAKPYFKFLGGTSWDAPFEQASDRLLYLGVDIAAVVGTVIRLAGFIRSMRTPDSTGARSLAIGNLACEAGLLAGLIVVVLAVIIRQPAPALGGMVLAVVASSTGLIVLLLYLRLLGLALHSKQLGAGLRNFVIWLVASLPSMALAMGVSYGMMYFGAQQRLLILWLAGLSLGVITLIGVPGTLVIKYLGLLSTASEQIGKRFRR